MIALDYDKLAATPVDTNPFTHIVVPEFVPPALLSDVVADLPDIQKGGSFPTGGLRLGTAAKAMVAELE
ncbi:MAG: 2OG-Fe(II) oxygenase, partial [Deltaproteobacteria bacterium]